MEPPIILGVIAILFVSAVQHLFGWVLPAGEILWSFGVSSAQHICHLFCKSLICPSLPNVDERIIYISYSPSFILIFHLL